MTNFFYSFNELKNKKEWKDLSFPINCHYGQKKLLFTEIFFINRILEDGHNLKDFIFIYAGSAPGDHIPILLELYKDITIHLIDPAPHNKNLYKIRQISIMTAYFNDESARILKDKYKNRKIVLISDLRVTNKSNQIIEDNQLQFSAIMILRPVYYFLKFRLPFYEKDKPTNILLKTTEHHIQSNDKYKYSYQYLDGELIMQPYATYYGAELRLLGNSFKLRNYDIMDYEQKMFYWNDQMRPHIKYEFMKSSKLAEYYKDYDINYESAYEYYVIHKYHELTKNKNDVFQTIFMINNMFLRIRNNTYTRVYDMFKFMFRTFKSKDSSSVNSLYLKHHRANNFIEVKKILNRFKEKEVIVTEHTNIYNQNVLTNINKIEAEIYK